MSEYDPRKDSFDSYNVAIGAMRAKLLAERCPAAKRVEVIGNCELYLGDCAEIIGSLEGEMDLLTDPPYGVGAGMMSLGKWRTSKMKKSNWDSEAPNAALFEVLMANTRRQIIWGGNYFGLPPRRGFLIWNKGAGFKGRKFAECEFAWCSMDMNARVCEHDPLARGDYRDKKHPTQKPLALMQWCLTFLPGGRAVLDSFMGSGTTGVASVKNGRRFIGIERDPGYFEVACERIRDEHRQHDMFQDMVAAPPATVPRHDLLSFDAEPEAR